MNYFTYGIIHRDSLIILLITVNVHVSDAVSSKCINKDTKGHYFETEGTSFDTGGH